MAERTILSVIRYDGEGTTETAFHPQDDSDYKAAAAGIFTLMRKSEYFHTLVMLLLVGMQDEKIAKQFDECIIDVEDFNNLLKNLKIHMNWKTKAAKGRMYETNLPLP